MNQRPTRSPSRSGRHLACARMPRRHARSRPHRATSIGRQLHPNDGATAWIAAHCPIPALMAGSRMTATRVTLRRDLLEQLQPFGAHAVFELEEAGGVAARPRQAFDKTGAHRVDDLREHDWHGAGRLAAARRGRAAGGQDDVWRERDQFGRIFAKSVDVAGSPSGIRSARCGRPPSPLPAAPAGTPPCRACASGSSAARFISTPMRRIVGCCARAASGHASRRAAEQRDELAPLHSITSSARASSVGGTSRPSALAVLRLITSSYLVGACTGRSAGFSPLRMRST